MDVRTDVEYCQHMTARQWALQGYLPVDGATGVELWANKYYQDYYTYYSFDEVEKATPEQIKDYFRPERERRNYLAWRKRAERKEQELEEKEREGREKVKQMIERAVDKAVTPYRKKIDALEEYILDAIRQRAHASNKHGGNGCFVIDTETTGLDPTENELLQVSIINDSGEIMFDSYFRPFAESWDDAQEINGISPEMVQDAPRIYAKMDEINGILASAGTIIGYNTSFDLDFLSYNGLILPDDIEIIDVMQEFAPVFGEWSEYHGGYKWQKLTTAAAYYGYDWSSRPEGAHNSLADCFATLFVYQKMQENPKDT